MGRWSNINDRVKYLEKILSLVALCPHGLFWDGNWVSTVSDRLLIAWAIERGSANVLEVSWCSRTRRCVCICVDCVWNVMAHAQKPDFIFHRNGRVHLNRLGRQFSRLLAAEVCASAVVMMDTPRSEVAWRVLATRSFRQFHLYFTYLRHRVSSRFNSTLLTIPSAPFHSGNIIWRRWIRIYTEANPIVIKWTQTAAHKIWYMNPPLF